MTAVIIMCVTSVVLMVVNAFLVVSLHRQNKKFAVHVTAEKQRADVVANQSEEEKPESENK